MGSIRVPGVESSSVWEDWIQPLNLVKEWNGHFSFAYHFVMANGDYFISNSCAAHCGKRRKDQFHLLAPFIALLCEYIQSINGFIWEWCCELGRWRNKAQIGQTTCPRTYKKLGNRSQISWDLCSAWLAHWLALLHVWDTFKPATLLGSFCNC